MLRVKKDANRYHKEVEFQISIRSQDIGLNPLDRAWSNLVVLRTEQNIAKRWDFEMSIAFPHREISLRARETMAGAFERSKTRDQDCTTCGMPYWY